MNAPLPAPPGKKEDDGELPRGVVIATMAGVIAAMLMGALDGKREEETRRAFSACWSRSSLHPCKTRRPAPRCPSKCDVA